MMSNIKHTTSDLNHTRFYCSQRPVARALSTRLRRKQAAAERVESGGEFLGVRANNLIRTLHSSAFRGVAHAQVADRRAHVASGGVRSRFAVRRRLGHERLVPKLEHKVHRSEQAEAQTRGL